MKIFWIGAAVFLLAGCDNGGSSAGGGGAPAPVLTPATAKNTGAFANLDPWVLQTTDANANRGNHGVYLANGAVGMGIGADGALTKESVVFLAGGYTQAERYAPVALHPSLLADAVTATPYKQSLDMRSGIVTTTTGGTTRQFFVPAQSPREPATGSPILAMLQKEGSFYAASGGASGMSVTTTDAAKFDRIEKAHADIWVKNWKTADITIEGDPEAQQLVRKCLFDLWQSTRTGGDHSIAPEALSGDFYKGHIFWDAEVWMFPALVAQRPDLAKSLLDYRFKHLAAARAQAKSQNCAGADFPWESASSGKEVAPNGFSTGRHVTAGVGWAHWQYYLVTQDKAWLASRGWPVLSAVADYWATKAKKGADGKYHITKVFGPDELKGTVDDNTYTNAMARYCLLAASKAAKIVGKPANGQWAMVASGLFMPFDKARNLYLARTGDDGRATKQADGELVLYPAQLPMNAQTRSATFDFHAPRPIKNGPAMTASIHALLAARLGRANQAEEFFRESYRPFVRGAFLLFSEKRSLDRCVFTTGVGGVLQSVIYGFGGVDYENWNTFAKTPVTLPPSWKKLTIKGLVHGGKRYTLVVTPQGRTLTPL